MGASGRRGFGACRWPHSLQPQRWSPARSLPRLISQPEPHFGQLFGFAAVVLWSPLAMTTMYRTLYVQIKGWRAEIRGHLPLTIEPDNVRTYHQVDSLGQIPYNARDMASLDMRFEIRCKGEDKARWQEAADLEERKLADWIRLVLRREAAKLLRRKGSSR